MKTLIILLAIYFVVPGLNTEGQEVVRDCDGNEYKTLKIGTQIWMTENLKVTHFCNGESIPGIQDSNQWSALTSGAYCNVTNDPAKADSIGRFYNWYAVSDNRNICPAGWHIPSESEWQVLIKYFSESAEAKRLNEKLFRLLQEDFRGYDGEFLGNGYGGGGWWSSTPVTIETAYYHGINYTTITRVGMEGRKTFGYCIRCIKD